MNIFNTCFNRRGLYLSEDEDDEQESGCCCFNKRQEGRIKLPHKRTIDDYLDPRSPVNIEALLAEEELDLYNNEEEVQAGSSKFNPLTLNHISPFFDEEDAQFISEHRISAILVERPKLSSAHALKEEQQENVIQQELMDFITPKPSNSSTSVISTRRFAFKEQTTQELTDFTHIPATEEDAPLTTKLSSLIPTNTNTHFPATTLSRVPAPSTSTTKPPRRPSVTSVLGDKLDDFTGKLAFIKKNMKDHERLEDEFDFSQVTKNVRTFGEGVMGNGIRMFNKIKDQI